MRGFGWLRRRPHADGEFSEREQIVWQVRLAEKARRFEDMASAVVVLVQCVTTSHPNEHHQLHQNPHIHPNQNPSDSGAGSGSGPTTPHQQQHLHAPPSDAQPHSLLTREERNLFAVAFKSVADRRRTALRGLELLHAPLLREALATKTDCTDSALLAKLDQLELMQLEVALELRSLCDGVIELIRSKILPLTEWAIEERVFFTKLTADYFRYLVEIERDSTAARSALVRETDSAYRRALELATEAMGPSNGVRLGVALNYSVFLYELASAEDRACHMARQAIDEAHDEMEGPNDSREYRDASLILQLLNENLIIWMSDEGHTLSKTLSSTEKKQSPLRRRPTRYGSTSDLPHVAA